MMFAETLSHLLVFLDFGRTDRVDQKPTQLNANHRVNMEQMRTSETTTQSPQSPIRSRITRNMIFTLDHAAIIVANQQDTQKPNHARTEVHFDFDEVEISRSIGLHIRSLQSKTEYC